MSSSAAVSPPDASGDAASPPLVPGTASSNFTLLYIIIAVLVGVVLYVAVRYGRSVLAEWRHLQAAGDDQGAPHAALLGLGADEIEALPTFTYQARAASASASPQYGGRKRSGSKGRAAAAVECVVCLQELEDGDVVRVLPACRHFFHGRCIDAWLRAHATCPVCRAHPEPDLLARLGEGAAVSPPLPQLRRCGVSPERPAASRVLADILARSPLRSSCSTSGSNKEVIVSKSPSPRLHFGSRSPSPTPPTAYGGVGEWWSNSPPPGVPEIVVVRSKSPSPMRFGRQLSARSMGVLESMEVITWASPSPEPIREGVGGSLSKSKSPSPVPH